MFPQEVKQNVCPFLLTTIFDLPWVIFFPWKTLKSQHWLWRIGKSLGLCFPSCHWMAVSPRMPTLKEPSPVGRILICPIGEAGRLEILGESLVFLNRMINILRVCSGAQRTLTPASALLILLPFSQIHLTCTTLVHCANKPSRIPLCNQQTTAYIVHYTVGKERFLFDFAFQALTMVLVHSGKSQDLLGTPTR